tara:strand:- start:6 stop:605 length:600 start_codon:yes stop_codon:yes gene_type:complete
MIEAWFATPVYYEDVGTDEISKEITAYLEERPFRSALGVWNDNCDITFDRETGSQGTKSHTNMLAACPTFKHTAITNATRYLGMLGHPPEAKPEFVYDAWANRTKKGQYQNYHLHGDADISGVYYHESTGEHEQGSLILKNPSSAFEISRLTGNQPQDVHYPPVQGRLFLFPGFLEHAVLINQTNTPRISVAFNLKISF